jgi:hypothetical protein
MTAAVQERIADIGPAMKAITEKQRRYVLALFDAPKNHGAMTFAARPRRIRHSDEFASEPRFDGACLE